MSDDRLERGKKIARSVLGKTTEWNIDGLAKISPMHGRAIYEYCYGTVWAEPHLPIKIKEFILIAVCAAQGEYEGVERQNRGGINMGATQKEIVEAITTCAPYIGYPRTNASLRVAQSVFDQWEAKKDEWKSA
jgi:4-carboxymuconolactone decarboxylase